MLKFVGGNIKQTQLAPIAQQLLPSQWGEIIIQANRWGLCRLGLHSVAVPQLVTANDEFSITQAVAHVDMAVQQLQEYLAGQRQQFSLSLAPSGTAFRRQVWSALTDVEYGQTCSYSDIATSIVNPKAVRAVGAANGANPIAIIVPCHRVIGKSGAMTGYAFGVEMKRGLLSLESASMGMC